MPRQAYVKSSQGGQDRVPSHGLRLRSWADDGEEIEKPAHERYNGEEKIEKPVHERSDDGPEKEKRARDRWEGDRKIGRRARGWYGAAGKSENAPAAG